MHKSAAILLAIAFVLLLSNQLTLFSILEEKSSLEEVLVSRVIDGDTLKLNDGRTLRLVNINAPESNTVWASETTNFLKQYENKSLKMKNLGGDKYGRVLAQVYDKGYINELLVSEGLASKFLVQESEKSKFAELESTAIEQEKGIWKHSQYYGCFFLSVDALDEFVRIENNCNFSIEGYSIKDESRKIYKFGKTESNKIVLHTFNGSDNKTYVYWSSKQPIWNDDRDSAYLFDEKGKLAAYHVYGYGFPN